jgi:predicted DNA-binding transcriptional regulator AlpA
MSNIVYIDLNKVCQITGLTRRSIYNMEKGDFPKRVKLITGRSIPIYNENEVEEWSNKYKSNMRFKKDKCHSSIYDNLINEIIGE